MAYTIQQKRLVDRVSEILVSQRAATKRQCVSINAELVQYGASQMALDKSQSFATNLNAFLSSLQQKQAEITTAANLVGVSDFLSRWQELDTVRSTLETATTENIGTRLQAIVDGLPDETII